MQEITREVLETHKQFIVDQLGELYSYRTDLEDAAEQIEGAQARTEEAIKQLETVYSAVSGDLLKDELDKFYATDTFFTDAAVPAVTLRFGFDTEPPLQ